MMSSGMRLWCSFSKRPSARGITQLALQGVGGLLLWQRKVKLASDPGLQDVFGTGTKTSACWKNDAGARGLRGGAISWWRAREAGYWRTREILKDLCALG